MSESWLPVRDFEGHYEVSDLGNLYSVPRIDGMGRRRGGRRLRPYIETDGYAAVTLVDHDRTRHAHVHILVAEAFIGPRPLGDHIRHLDGDPGNNAASNLAYGTPAENVQDCLRHGRHVNARRTHCRRRHELAGVNLDAGFLERHGGRRCIACSRGWGSVQQGRKHGLELDIQIEADRHYDLLMSR